MKERDQALDWLYPGDTDTKHVDISKKRQENTGGWLFEKPEFKAWSDGVSKSKLLLGYGIRKWCAIYSHRV